MCHRLDKVNQGDVFRSLTVAVTEWCGDRESDLSGGRWSF